VSLKSVFGGKEYFFGRFENGYWEIGNWVNSI